MKKFNWGDGMLALCTMVFTLPVLTWAALAGSPGLAMPLTAWGAPLLIALGTLIVALAMIGPSAVGDNVEHMSRLFGPWARLVLLLIAVDVLAQGAFFIYVFVMMSRAGQGSTGVIPMIVVATVGLLGFGALIKAAFATFHSPPMVVRGIKADRERFPRLFELVDSVAQKVGIQPPDHLLLGLEPNFYVTTHPVRALSTGEKPLEGQTMYLSLAMMRVLTAGQLAAIIGHEMGHFKGKDALYSTRFAPTYTRFNGALEELSAPTPYRMVNALKWPIVKGVEACFVEFARTVRAVSRQRELEADRTGSQVTDPKTAAAALVATSLWGPAWAQLLHAAQHHLNNNAWYDNMSVMFQEVCRHNGKHVDMGEAREHLMKSVQAHPFDTHPSLGQRLEALKVKIDQVMTAQLPDEAAIGMLDDIEEVERGLTGIEGAMLCKVIGKDVSTLTQRVLPKLADQPG